jgi:HEAT repeat protein
VAGNSRRPTPDQVASEVVPTLIELIKTSDNRDIIDSALVAVARAAREGSADLVIGTATPMLSHKELSVQTAATLALGVMGSPKALPTITALMTDSAEGRKLVGGGEVPPLVRAFGALSHGLINDPTSVQGLVSLVEKVSNSDKDIRVAALVSLGMMNNEKTGDAYQFLIKKLDDSKLDAVIRAYVPTSLGKLGNVEAVPALLKTFEKDKEDSVRQSAAIALGTLASLSQADVIKALTSYIDAGKDQQTRHFCFMSLAQIGGRAAEEAGNQEAHDALTKLFLTEMKGKTNAGHRSWAALASAIYAMKYKAAGPALVEGLIEGWDKEKEPSFKDAFSLALGLLDVDAMGPQLFEAYKNEKDPEHKGYMAVALGFLNYTEAAELLREECKAKSASPTYRLQVATGLGLMGDLQAVGVLIATLESAETLGVSSAVAKALGLIGDANAIAPLKAIALDSKKQPIVRAFACVALGIVSEKTDLPWNARISADNNYRARVPAIDEILDIL